MTLSAGTVIAGFRLDRVIGRGTRATVYEATQISLDRRVALKVMHDRTMADRVRRLSWPEHPGAVSLFAVGDSDHGPWLAMRLMSGETLETRRASLNAVAAALAQAHAARIVHGDVTARNVLVEGGRGYLSDFGLAPGDATPEDDCARLAELTRSRAPRGPRRRALGVVAAVAALAVVAGAVARATGDRRAGDSRVDPPLVPAGVRSIGSDLAPGAVESIGCDGRAPSGASLACTISQRQLAGRPVVVPVDGTVTSWAVRGARGTMALQVLRGRGSRLVQVGRSGDEAVPGADLHVVQTNLAVTAGDRVGLEVFPTATVGIRRSGPRASTDRWFGPLLEPARPPERPAGTGLDAELLLRIDITPAAGTTVSPARFADPSLRQ